MVWLLLPALLLLNSPRIQMAVQGQPLTSSSPLSLPVRLTVLHSGLYLMEHNVCAHWLWKGWSL